MAWDFSENKTVVSEGLITTASKYTLLVMKEYLVTMGWTVTYSSDASASVGAADYWPSSSSPSSLNTDAWIVLESALGNELCFQYKGVNKVYAKFSHKRVLDQSYDLTTMPTATDLYYFNLISFTFCDDCTYFPFSNSYTLYMMWNSTNDSFIVTMKVGVNYVCLFAILGVEGSTDNDDTYVVIRVGHPTSTSAHILMSQIDTPPSDRTFSTYMVTPLSGDAGSLYRGTILYYLVSTTQLHTVMNRDPVDNSVFEFPVFPIHGTQGFITGRTKDFHMISELAAAQSDLLTDQSTGDRLVIGDFTIPWNNDTP